MRRAILLTLLGLTLSWGSAQAAERLSTLAAASPAAATASFQATLPAGPLDGVLYMLPPNCPRLCNLTQGTSCTGNPLTEPCYDSFAKQCRTCNCTGNHTWSCYPVA